MDTLQPAVQGDYTSNGRAGAHFDIVESEAEPVCPP
jgi:hypothetical protein